MSLNKIAFAATLTISFCAQANTNSVSLEAFDIEWNSANLVLEKVGTNGSLYEALNPEPDFSADSATVFFQFSWLSPLTLSGTNETSFFDLPIFNVKAHDGWAITAAGEYFNGGMLSADGDAVIRAWSNAQITFDKPKAVFDQEYRSISPAGSATTSSTWQLADTVYRAIECDEENNCIGAKFAKIDTSQSFAAVFGPNGGTANMSFRPIWMNDEYSLQRVKVEMHRISEVPEPGTLKLLILGVAGIAFSRMAKMKFFH